MTLTLLLSLAFSSLGAFVGALVFSRNRWPGGLLGGVVGCAIGFAYRHMWHAVTRPDAWIGAALGVVVGVAVARLLAGR